MRREGYWERRRKERGERERRRKKEMERKGSLSLAPPLTSPFSRLGHLPPAPRGSAGRAPRGTSGGGRDQSRGPGARRWCSSWRKKASAHPIHHIHNPTPPNTTQHNPTPPNTTIATAAAMLTTTAAHD